MFKGRYIIFLGLFVGILHFSILEAQEQSNGANEYLVNTVALKDNITIKEAQEGFAGITGEILTIEPSGHWELSRFLNDRLKKPHQSGQLEQDQLKAIAKLLSKHNFQEMSPVYGRDLKINRHRISISFGEKKITFDLAPRQQPRDELSKQPEDKNWQNFTAIFETIKGLTTEKPSSKD